MALVADYGMSSEESDDEMSTDTQIVSSQPAKVPTEEDDVLEDFVKKTNYGDDVPEKPPPKATMSQALYKMRLPSARKGKIQISVPTVEDSDSEDDEPRVKKTKSSTGAAGFLGSLPAPRGSGGGKDAGKTFIPYTLTKNKPANNKPTPPARQQKPTVKATKTTTATTVGRLTEAYSDSDDDVAQPDTADGASTNFFSLSSESKPLNFGIAGGINATPSLVNNAPSSNEVGERTQPRLTAASLYNMSGDNEYNSMDTGYTESYMEESSSSKEVDDLLQNEQFLRLQGKKQRGKEAIDIIDVHTDDQKVSELELTKNLTEEVDPSAYAHRKKGEGPSGQQKRKHQITYLAFQAKERELELKNTWAANKATKQQTQAKYGF